MRDELPLSPAPVRARGLITGQIPSLFERIIGPYAALRGNRPLTLLFIAHTFSAFIDWLYVVALFILAYALTHSATVVALLTFTRLLPYALLLPVSGAITDRFNPRALMVVANVGRALAVLALTFVHTSASLPLAFLLVFLATTLSSLFRPALLASVPAVVPDRELIRANSMLGQVDMAAFGGGPALAGFLILVGDARLALLVAGAGLFLSAAAAGAVRLPQRPARDSSEMNGIPAAWDGLRFLVGQNERVLLGIAVAWGGLTFFGGAYWALSVVLAVHAFHLGGAGVGFINASYAVGGLLGGFVVAVLVTRLGATRVFIATAAASSIAEALFGLSPAGVLPFLFFFLTGLADSLAKITATSFIQVATPRHLLGRVFGAFESLFIFAMAMGSLIVGPAIGALGARTACAVLATIGLALLVLCLPLLLRLDRALGLRLFLFQAPVMNLLPFELMDQVVRCLHRERHRAGNAIVRQGETGDRMYLVKSGRVGVTVEREGREVPLAVLKRGDYFGEMALLHDTERTATCRCLEDVEVYSLLREDFQDLLERSEAFGEAIRAESTARDTASRQLLLLRS